MPYYSRGDIAPVVLMTMLHIYCLAEPLRAPNAPATLAALHYLQNDGLIVTDGGKATGYAATVKGREWVVSLLQLEPPGAALEWVPASLHNPPEPGWYPCATRPDRNCLRWWNGTYWSKAAHTNMTAERAAHFGTRRTAVSTGSLRWAMPWWQAQPTKTANPALRYSAGLELGRPQPPSQPWLAPTVAVDKPSPKTRVTTLGHLRQNPQLFEDACIVTIDEAADNRLDLYLKGLL